MARDRGLVSDLPVIYMSGAGGHRWAANAVPSSLLEDL